MLARFGSSIYTDSYKQIKHIYIYLYLYLVSGRTTGVRSSKRGVSAGQDCLSEAVRLSVSDLLLVSV